MKTIVQKLHEGFQYFSYLYKDKRNAFHKYTYVSEANVKEHAQKMCKELGILFHYSVVYFNQTVEQRGDSWITSAVVKIKYSFINVDDHNDIIEGYSYGTAQDTGDKALYKAITGGLKYIFFTTFLAPSGDEPEDDDIDAQISKTDTKAVPLSAKKTITKDSNVQVVKTPTVSNSEPQDATERVIIEELGGKKIAQAQPVSIETLREKFMTIQLTKEAQAVIESMDKCTSLDELKTTWALIPKKEKMLKGVAEFKEIKKHELEANNRNSQ